MIQAYERLFSPDHDRRLEQYCRLEGLSYPVAGSPVKSGKRRRQAPIMTRLPRLFAKWFTAVRREKPDAGKSWQSRSPVMIGLFPAKPLE